MKRRNIFLIIGLFLTVFLLTGCGNKTKLTTKEFESIAKKHNCTIYDVSNQYASYGFIKEAKVAKNDDWQIEFYIIDSAKNADVMYNINKQVFEGYKGSTSVYKTETLKNYSTYLLKSNGYYMYLSRVDNTLLYVKVNDTYQKQVEKIIKDMGY